MTEMITVSINKEKLPMYHQVQELMSLAEGCSDNLTSVVSENYTELVDILGLEVALIIHTHLTSISRARYFYTQAQQKSTFALLVHNQADNVMFFFVLCVADSDKTAHANKLVLVRKEFEIFFRKHTLYFLKPK